MQPAPSPRFSGLPTFNRSWYFSLNLILKKDSLFFFKSVFVQVLIPFVFRGIRIYYFISFLKHRAS